MKRYVFQPIMAFGLACSFLLSLHAQPCAKNGKIIFTENNQLKDFDHLALVLRY